MPQRQGKKYFDISKYSKFLKPILQGVCMFAMIGIIAGCMVASVLTVYILNTLDNSASVVLEDVKLNYSTIIYAMNSKTGEFEEIEKIQTNEDRIWVDISDIPQCVQDAAIAVEDKRFLSHSGIDFRRTIGAAVEWLNPFSGDMYGGSTITQQVIKNVTGDKEATIPRKIRELFRAIDLEKNYSKEQILEVYLNTIALGNGHNGVQSASLLYFGKPVTELAPAEGASLIAITQNPSKWDPFRFPENNRDRQLMVLKMMNEQYRSDGKTKILPDADYETAVAQEMEFKTDEYAKQREEVQNWFIDTVYKEVKDDLVEKAGYTQAGASDALKTGGFRIYTTVDTEMQDYLEKAYINPETFPPIRNAEYPESAFVILDYDGQIKAIVSSNREKEGARLFNRATSHVRHPGSTIKPLSAYALAVENDLIHWSMLWEDSPILLNSDDPTSVYPKNFYLNYLGNITIKEAIQRSTNTIPVKLVQLLSPRTSFNFMRDKLGFKNLVERQTINGAVYSDIDLAPMALGSMTGGVTPLEMAAAYQMFGNGGLYNEPHSYTKVLDSEGNVILENKVIPTRVISPETATIVNKLLQQVTSSAPGTGTPAKFSAMPVAGKTGTSDKDYNQWFIGLTPYYVGTCWVGYDELETVNYSGFRYPPPIIWKNIMAPIHQNLEIKNFETLGNVVEKTYCLKTGCLATADCTETSVGWYKESFIPPACNHNGDPPAEEDPLMLNDSYWNWIYDNDKDEDED